MKVYKIHIPHVPKNQMVGELKNILVAGVINNQQTVFCDDPEQADYIFLDFRHLLDIQYEVNRPEKTIIVDYRDNQTPLFPDPSLLYFKRSVVDRSNDSFLKYDREVIPISHCLRDEYAGLKSQFKKIRDIDIAVFFNPDEDIEKARNYYRTAVAQLIKNEFKSLNIFVGIAGESGPLGRNNFQREYFDVMTRSKIIVTCNPDRWEGDYRLFEALGSGSLVLSDKMLTPVTHPFRHNQHLVYYDKSQLDGLIVAIKDLLSDDAKRVEIASNGYEYTMKFHTAAERVNEILGRVRLIEER